MPARTENRGLSGRRSQLGVVFQAISLAFCLTAVPSACGTVSAPSGPIEPGPDRNHWRQQLTFIETTELRIRYRSADPSQDAIGVSVVGDAHSECFASIFVPGQGGPDSMIGEQLETSYRGRPAIRNGAGAETDYLTWRLADDRWVRVTCDSTELVDRIAGQVQVRPSSLRIPFDLGNLPSGYRPMILQQDPEDQSATVYLDRPGQSDSTIAIRLDGLEPRQYPGDPTAPINGHPAWTGTDDRRPAVNLLVQNQAVHVFSDAGDTDPYPDRSADRPILLALATDLTFADDLTDPTTWFPAEDVFG